MESNFKPRKGPEGRGRQRIWVNKGNAHLIDAKKCIRPVMSLAKAGNSGKLDCKVVPLFKHPINPTDKDMFVFAFEVENVTMRSVDVDAKTSGEGGGASGESGRARFELPVSEEIAKLLDAIDEGEIRHILSSRPGTYSEYIQTGNNLNEKVNNVPSVVLWWAMRDDTFGPHVESIRTRLGYMEACDKWNDEEHKEFQEALWNRFVVAKRNMFAQDPGPDATADKMRDFRKACKPLMPRTVYRREERPPVVSVCPLNFKNGKEETTKRNGKNVNREQTRFALYDPETDTTTVIERTEDALRHLMHSSKGTPGYATQPFTIHVDKAVFSIRHRWMNGSGGNRANDFELLKWHKIENDDNAYDEALGLVRPKPEVTTSSTHEPAEKPVPEEPAPEPAKVEEPAEEKKAADDEEKSAKGKNADDDDEKPKKKERGNDEEDKPAKKKKKERDDDDDEDAKPAKKKKKKVVEEEDDDE